MIALFLTFLIAQAEYRAFDLEIIDTKSGQSRLVTTSLDPDQYPGYYPLASNERIRMKATWMCFEDTWHQEKICPNPRPENPKNTSPVPLIPN